MYGFRMDQHGIVTAASILTQAREARYMKSRSSPCPLQTPLVRERFVALLRVMSLEDEQSWLRKLILGKHSNVAM